MSKIKCLLDCAIRDDESGKGGYKKGEKLYPNYMSQDEWEEYLHRIPEAIQKAITKELAGNPPHMACFGSSCRMAYNLLKEVKGVEFEKVLSIKTSRGNANLDAYLKEAEAEICVEAKCHEIYEKHKGCKAYIDVYKFLNERNEKFVFDAEKLTFTYDGEEIAYFDLKQLICHYLGISAAILRGKIGPDIRFLYLIYNPEKVAKLIDKRYSDKILAIYERVKEEMALFENWLFDAIFEYQKQKICPSSDVVYRFEFHRVDQESWREHLK